VGIQRLPIKEFIEQQKNGVLLDVRSPGEFNHAHIPGAHSLPLFSDEERKVVGTIYKQQNRELAIKAGLDFFGPKMKKMIEEAENMVSNLKLETSKLKQVYVYCWRGGMRSAGVAWLLDLYGFKVYSLAGGYKAFRNYVLQTFAHPHTLKIIGGFTGSGKTVLLKELDRKGEAVIDLEQLASHRGSAFGSFNMPEPPKQEMFENLLAWQLRSISGTPGRIIWLEDESQRIGNNNIPSALWQNMRNSPVIFLEIPFEERLNYLTTEYGSWEAEKLIESVQRISKRLGGLETKNTIAFLQEGNIKEAFRILLHYYDKRYLKSLHNREDMARLLTKLTCDTVGRQNVQALLNKVQPA
jgi:tRNA 2-selenouridine synthase